MKQTEMFRKAKPRFCCWLVKGLGGFESCEHPAVVMIKKASYCAEHAEKAVKLFGPATPIYALDK